MLLPNDIGGGGGKNGGIMIGRAVGLIMRLAELNDDREAVGYGGSEVE